MMRDQQDDQGAAPGDQLGQPIPAPVPAPPLATPEPMPPIPPTAQPIPPTVPPAPITEQPAPGADWATPPVAWADRGSASESLVAPVAPVPVPPRSRGGLRWVVAFVVVVLVAAIASAAFIALSGSSSSSSVARWAPAGSLLYLEGRFDLPGDQRAGLGQFLSSFPGFADQSTLDAKLSEAYDKIVRGASKGGQDYSTDIKPWFGGQVAVAMPTWPNMTAGGSAPDVRVAILVSVTDAAKASAWLTSLPASVGGSAPPPAATADYAGVSVTESSGPGEHFAYAVDGSVLVLGDVQTVHDVIDTKGTTGLTTTDGYKAAIGAYQGDHLAFVYVDAKRYLDAVLAALPAGSAATLPATLLDRVPPWVAVAVRAASGRLILDVAQPSVTGAPATTDRISSIAGHLPATTIAELEAHDLGSLISNAFKAYAAIPAYQAAMTQVTAALDKVGGLESFTSLVGDSAIVVTKDGATYGGGVVIALPSAAAADTAQAKLDLLKGFVSLSGSSGVTVNDAAYNGATITTIDFGDASQLGPQMGIPSVLPGGRPSLSYTVKDGFIVFGVGGDGFVKAVIDAKAGSSLADQARYKAAIDAVGGANASQGYVDLRAVVDAAATTLTPDQQAQYERDVKPYLDPLQAFAVAGHGGTIQHALTVLTVGQ